MRLVEFSDGQLNAELQQGNEEAFAVLVTRHSPKLAVLARRRLGYRVSHEDIQDVVSDVFVDAWRRRAEYDPVRSAYSTWLTWLLLGRIAGNQRRLRREAAQSRLDPDTIVFDPGEPFVDEVDRSLLIEEMMAKFWKHSPADALLVEDRYLRDHSASQVATALGISEGAARVRISRALAKLRRLSSDEIS